MTLLKAIAVLVCMAGALSWWEDSEHRYIEFSPPGYEHSFRTSAAFVQVGVFYAEDSGNLIFLGACDGARLMCLYMSSYSDLTRRWRIESPLLKDWF